jgi:integrase/recombinase XerD
MEVKEFLDIEETGKLEAATVCLRDRLLVRITRRVGCRITEELGLAVQDIDFVHGRMTIEHLKARIKLSCPDCGTKLGKRHTFCPGCGHKVQTLVQKEEEHRRIRTIPVDRETLDLIQAYIKAGGPVSKNGRRLLFNISRQRAWQIFVEAAGRAGLPHIINPETGRVHKVSPHKMRDSFAISAVKHDDSGDGLRLLQEQLGHKDISTTMHYRKVAGKELKNWYDDLVEEGK